MHTDTFSFEVENEGEVYKVRINEMHTIQGRITWAKIFINGNGLAVSTEMNWQTVRGSYLFDNLITYIPQEVQSLEQKISDKIININK
jgi:hypothetical protein